MSIKLNELSVQTHNGKLVVAKKNKRDQISDYLEISTQVINHVIKCLTTKRDKTFIHQEIIDPETGEKKHYKITCYEMTSDEVLKMEQNDKIRKSNSEKSYNNLMSLLVSSFIK